MSAILLFGTELQNIQTAEQLHLKAHEFIKLAISDHLAVGSNFWVYLAGIFVPNLMIVLLSIGI